MASITKSKHGWRAQLSVKGVRDSGRFSTKAEAQAWAVDREAQLRRMVVTGINTDKTCRDAFERYLAEISSQKRGQHWEEVRLRAIDRHPMGCLSFGEMRISNVCSGRDLI